MRRLVLSLLAMLLASPATAEETLPLLYWAEASGKETVIDVTVFENEESGAVAKLAERYPGDGAKVTLIPHDEPLLPERFKVGQRYLVITTGGPVTISLRDFDAFMGAGETHLRLHLEPFPVKARSGGLAMPAESVKDPSRLKLRALRRERLPALALKAVIDAANAGLSDADKDKLGKRRIAAGDVRAWSGQFPAGLKWVVSVTRKLDVTEYVAGFELVGVDGKVGATLSAPGVTLNHSEALFALDLDGDGKEEIIFDDDYYEGHYRMLLRWEGDVPKAMVLTGDGA